MLFVRLITWLRVLFHVPIKAKADPVAENIEDHFQYAFEYLKPNEGGFSNDPADTPTNFGITMADLAKWRKREVTIADVRDMHIDEAEEIFHAWYWTDINLGLIKNRAIATAIFDQGVLNGVRTAISMAQSTCNNCGFFVVVDGVIDEGEATVKALNQVDTDVFLFNFRQMLKSRFADIVKLRPAKKKFYGDWVRRADRILTLKSNPNNEINI